MNLATETFIKEVLSNILGRVRSNGEDYIKTAAYKKQLQREEELSLNNEVQRNAAGLLPVEVEESRRRKPVDLEDLRVALQLGDSYFGQVPLVTAGIVNARYDTDGYDEMDIDEPNISIQTRSSSPARVSTAAYMAVALDLQQAAARRSTVSMAPRRFRTAYITTTK